MTPSKKNIKLQLKYRNIQPCALKTAIEAFVIPIRKHLEALNTAWGNGLCGGATCTGKLDIKTTCGAGGSRRKRATAEDATVDVVINDVA